MSGRVKAAAEPPTLLGGGAGMVTAGFLAAGIAFLAIGLLVPPRDALFWVAFALLPLLAGTISAILAVALGRRLDARLLGDGTAKAFKPPAAAALPEAARAALLAAAVPALLAQLVGKGVPRPARAAADGLLAAVTAAWNAAPDEAARAALARELPGLVAGLLDGEPAGIRAAEAAAARLAPPAGGTR
ncbi:hypothetical protein [Roseomonas sp. HF4]|uniref:hypothetical protein n=1 Tax=Roseomonas sp. HF4 TaxID=2562313 RepID=UPI0010BFBA0E|nr:hypothetical protein [Roseomonas sp. HF4]